MKVRFSLWRRLFSPRNLLFLLGASPLPLRAQEPAAPLLERILLVEDRRARSPGDENFLRETATRGRTPERRAAIRALGRLENPRHAAVLSGMLDDPEPEVRREAAQAVAQALQGFRRDTIGSSRDRRWEDALASLGRRVDVESDPGVAGMLAISLGRLPYREDAGRLEGERRIRVLLGRVAVNAEAATMAVRGAETIRRLPGRGPRVDDSLTVLLRGIVQRSEEPGWLVARRRALGALLLTGPVTARLLEQAFASTDPELRRLAVSGAGARDSAGRMVDAARSDQSIIVRREAARALGQRSGPGNCTALADMRTDPDEGTRLMALDGFGTACSRDPRAAGLLRMLAAPPSPPSHWRLLAHALVALARIDAAGAAGALAQAADARPWQLRMYAARAAQHTGDTALLDRLAADAHPNVREAAITALRALAPRRADAAAIRALGARDYQLVLTAADALQGTDRRDEARLALVDALDRITRDGAETSRDTRVALLVRLREVGGARLADRIRPRLRDFDPAVAESAAVILPSWTGMSHRAEPRRSLPDPVRFSEIEALRGARLRLVMESGDTLVAELLTAEAPLTVARIARLARRGYYDGLTFHRVAPNFVIQGGSPGANEYAGDGPYMRDELTSVSHERGTLGISTRGRDTGDAQLFVNLVDNARLDYDYTVWARVVAGMDALDRIGEGDVIRRVEVRAR